MADFHNTLGGSTADRLTKVGNGRRLHGEIFVEQENGFFLECGSTERLADKRSSQYKQQGCAGVGKVRLENVEMVICTKGNKKADQ